MAWVSNTGAYIGGIDTYNLSVSGPDEAMYTLLNLLKAAGWTCLGSGDGLAAYGASDVFTGYGSGANGLGNANAWFRVADPGNLREFVFQRGSGYLEERNWACLYSARDKFTGGAADPTTRPTATDEQGFAQGSSTTAQTIFGSSGAMICHILADGSVYSSTDVYQFWMVCVVPGGSSNVGCILCLAMEPGTFHSLDDEPVVLLAVNDDLDSGTNAELSDGGVGNSKLRCWMGRGIAGEEWHSVYCNTYFGDIGYYTVPGSMPNYAVATLAGLSVAPMLPMYASRHSSSGGSVCGMKGALHTMRWNPNPGAYSYTTVFDDGTELWMVIDGVCLAGWPSAAILPTS